MEGGNTMAKSKLEWGQEWLDNLHNPTMTYEHDLWSLQKGTRNGDFTLEDLGIDEKKLEELRVQNCKTAAKTWLERLQAQSEEWSPLYERALKVLHEGIKNGDFTPEDLGIKKEDLEELRIMNCKNLVRKLLKVLLAEINSSKKHLSSIYKEVQKGGFPLEEVGTSEENLKALCLITVEED